MSIYDLEHKDFLSKKRRRKRTVLILRIIVIVSFILLWELFSYFNLINTFLFSSPSKILTTIYNLLLNGNLL